MSFSAPRRLSLWILLALLGICLGCGRSGSYKVAAVTGRVTLDGQPLTGGIVTFVPDMQRKTKGPIGVGEIQRDGTYRIVTDPGGDAKAGAVVGFHRIRITHVPGERVDVKGRKPDPKTQFPRLFISEDTSGLNAEVRTGTTNTVNLDLKRPVSQL